MKFLLIGCVALSAATSFTAIAAQKSVVLSVPSMNCSACPITVTKALQKVPGVAKVKATLEPPEAAVVFDDSATSVEKLMEATRNAGYPSSVKSGQ
jgi:mercuric ion binding protein